LFAVPDSALRFGFSNESAGVHDGRTIMLGELRLLLDACPPEATGEQYRAAVIDDNVLRKQTAVTRRYSFRRLRMLYALDPGTVLFRALRDLWGDEPARPLLALLCAAARDTVLRATADVVMNAPEGTELTPGEFSRAVSERFPHRFGEITLATVGRNLASSWQQSGHLRGKVVKVRGRAECRPAAVAYALLLGSLTGAGGEGLLHTFWSRLLDAPPYVLQEQAVAAARRGWIDYRQAGGVVDVGFRYLLRNEG
jgi:hypothetical protein